MELCFFEGRYCLVSGRDVDGFIAGDHLTDAESGETLSNIESEKWAALRARTPRATKLGIVPSIRTEGDSYMAGAYGIRLTEMIAADSHVDVENTSLGGSTIDQAVARIVAPENAALLGRVTIFWDGSINGARDSEAYVETLSKGIAALGHNRFLVILPAHSAEAGVDVLGKVDALIVKKWPQNVVDWRSIVPNQQGKISSDKFAKPDQDRVHWGAAPLHLMSMAIVEEIRARGWL